MTKSWSTTTKIIVFVVFAFAFATLLIAFSGKYKKSDAYEYSTGDGKQNYNETFNVNPNDNLFLDVDFGDIIIKGSPDNLVHVKVTMKGSDEDIERYKVKFSQEGNTVKVECRHRGARFHFFNQNWTDAKYEISVPAEFNLDVSTSGGNVEIYNVKGEIEGSTSGGDVEANSLDGNIRMNTSGGNVVGKSLKGDLYLETSGGDIFVENSSGNLKAETSGGDIKILDCDAQVRASTSGGNIRTSLSDNKGIRLSTSGGNIVLFLPDSISGDIDADATGGNVSCELSFKGKLKDDNLRGTINGGGNEIVLETSGGNIDVNSKDQ